MTPPLRATAAAALLALLLPMAAAADIDATFAVLLDGTPIGEHRFVVSGPADARRVTSEARFAVKLMGLTVYRYRHSAVERWRGDCLDGLEADTDDDGARSQVKAGTAGEGLVVAATDAGTQNLAGCVMSFAYWNPAIRQQKQLLNAQTGKLEAAQSSRVGSGSVEVRGAPVSAVRWRIDGPARPIDVWYDAQGAWVGLDSTVAGGRRLSYRLK